MRKLASIQKIKNIEPIKEADAIEKATVLGWSVVVKKNEFKPGDCCVFFEIDSLLPDEPRYEFLKKSNWNPRYGKIRLRTIRLRKQISQGLALPLSSFPEIKETMEGLDLTETLGIEKYEPEIPACLGGEVNKFTWPISKSDEERIQNNPEGYIRIMNKKPYYITIKLDGSSGTFLLTEDKEFHVCSRNFSLKEKEGNTFWEIAKKYEIKKSLLNHYENTGEVLAIQGEVTGPGIQKNKLNLNEHKLFIFNIVNVTNNEKIHFDRARFLFPNIPFVPILEEGYDFPYNTLDELLELAKGKYKEHISTANAKQDREGIVVRSKDQSVSFKVINNDFLLKGGD